MDGDDGRVDFSDDEVDSSSAESADAGETEKEDENVKRPIVPEPTPPEPTPPEATPPEPAQRQFSQSEFNCACCFELMVDPTTLECGHSFCRGCLATWFLTSKKRQCPHCKQTWAGHPKVNILLRSTIEHLFGPQMSARIAELSQDSLSTSTTIQNFDKELSSQQNVGQEERNRGFCTGLMFALGILAVLYLAWYWHSTEDDILVRKPIRRWRVKDTVIWLSELGDWTEDIAQQAEKYHIDGHLLTAIDSTNIDSVFNISTPLHRDALLLEIQRATQLGVKPPNNLWDYKILYRGRALFLAFALGDNPRCTFLWAYLFTYDDLLLPVLQAIDTPYTEDISYTESIHNKEDDLTVRQLIEFIVYAMLFPYYLVGLFAYDWLNIHYWTSRMVIINCIALTVLDANDCLWFTTRSGWRSWRSLLRTIVKRWSSMLVVSLIWPLIPGFLCDCVFYWCLYITAFLNIEKIYHRLSHFNQMPG